MDTTSTLVKKIQSFEDQCTKMLADSNIDDDQRRVLHEVVKKLDLIKHRLSHDKEINQGELIHDFHIIIALFTQLMDL